MFNRKYFEALYADREESAKTIEKPSMSGVKDSVVDKYSDQAHFVYELLQNADDVKATKARFKLYHDRLVFAHNGSRHFSVSNPNTEAEDKKKGCLGDVNAILSIGNSTKTDSNTIGKFGVGFKAVFQYTSTPFVYDENIRFKIIRFFVPVLLEDDHSERNKNETLFEFPFNHEVNTSDIAFEEISDRLMTLVNPVLFLSNLKEISFEFDDTKGIYTKDIHRSETYNGITYEKVILRKRIDDQEENRELLLFSRVDGSNGKYTIGFYLDEENQLEPSDEPAYCFFPTKHHTGLHFIIHAPFLLNDSREGIKAGNAHNQRMMNLLATLAADSLAVLRNIGINENNRYLDDNILDLIPTKSFNQFDLWAMRDMQSPFEPFYTIIHSTLQTERLIPTLNSYTTKENAYWANSQTVLSVFDNAVLKRLLGNPFAEWVFVSTPREKCKQSSFVESIIREWLNEDRILSMITPTFIENCEVDWLADFYTWIGENNSRMKKSRNLPIFISSEGKGVPAYDDKGKLILFIPTDVECDFETVREDMLQNEDILAFLDMFGVKKPSLKNEIYNKVLPKMNHIYIVGDVKGAFSCYKKIFKYYLDCSIKEREVLIKELKNEGFLICGSGDTIEFVLMKELVYFPEQKLKEYFSVVDSTHFLAWDEYIKDISVEDEEFIRDFFIGLGVKKKVSIRNKPMTRREAYQRKSSEKWAKSNGQDTWSEDVIDGCSENLKYISVHQDVHRSVLLWNTLIEFIKSGNIDISNKLIGTHRYHYYTRYYETFESINVSELLNTKWLVDKTGMFVNPTNTYVNNLYEEYDTKSYFSKFLIKFLEIYYESPNMRNLTPEQKMVMIAHERLMSKGIDITKDSSILDKIIEQISRPEDIQYVDIDELEGLDFSKSETNTTSISVKSEKRKDDNLKNTHISEMREFGDEEDSDEYNPKTVDYQKKIQRTKDRNIAEIDKIARMEELQKKAVESSKYSYSWFKALLELEIFENNEDVDYDREISISFGKVEVDASAVRSLILRQPNRNIPRYMEELADIPLVLEFEDENKKLPIEVMSIRSFTLRVKLKPGIDISGIPFEKVKEARITAQNPVFLLDELKKQFFKLGFEEEFNMRDNLSENIDFIFGPPGTGKTTYLATDKIIPAMQKGVSCKILILTPTNKAADVIVNKIQEVMGKDYSYTDWLVRFGTTDDDEIETSGIIKDKNTDFREFDRLVLVTTIDRYPYDFFMPGGERHYIRNVKFDYVIFDEASMIPLVKLVYPLYHGKPERFIIAGDPFQIEPVVRLAMWEGQNIYTMVKLDSFADPKTVPYPYDVKLLTEQYRSVPLIGDLFSKMTYDGILKNHRLKEEQFSLDFGNSLDIKTLNIVKFPVSRYESIYRAKRLNASSPYHIYSALFSYEFTLWLAKEISRNNSDKMTRIGVIAAYRAQADMIDRLISFSDIPKSISIQTGTIHGFQGDECEIIVSVYNPPESISRKNKMFLNKKNIINVSISRARDYLFIIMPDDNTENVENLILIKKMEELIKNTNEYSEYSSNEIEQMIFGNTKYLEDNTFVTNHQSVNVYGVPEQIYEIRTENNAIDIQIHKKDKKT